MKLFNCLRYLLDEAKKASYFQQINQSNFTKPKLDCEKTQHFIEFLFSSGAIQEVAYGTTILKFNELEFQRIPKAVLTVMKSQIICMYKQYCESLTYKHLPESYLYIMFSELKLNQRKTSSGLDNITATGLSAINDMTELVKNDQLALTNSGKKELLQRIKRLTSNIKLKYCISCLKPCDGTNNHCPIFATSDSKCNELAEKFKLNIVLRTI